MCIPVYKYVTVYKQEWAQKNFFSLKIVLVNVFTFCIFVARISFCIKWEWKTKQFWQEQISLSYKSRIAPLNNDMNVYLC